MSTPLKANSAKKSGLKGGNSIRLHQKVSGASKKYRFATDAQAMPVVFPAGSRRKVFRTNGIMNRSHGVDEQVFQFANALVRRIVTRSAILVLRSGRSTLRHRDVVFAASEDRPFRMFSDLSTVTTESKKTRDDVVSYERRNRVADSENTKKAVPVAKRSDKSRVKRSARDSGLKNNKAKKLARVEEEPSQEDVDAATEAEASQ